MIKQEAKKRIAIFLSFTIVFSAIFHIFIAQTGELLAGGGLYVIGLMWSPGAAALLTQLITKGNVRGLGWRWGKTRYQLLSIGLPLVLIAVTYGIVWLTGLGSFPNAAFVDEIRAEVGFDVSEGAAILIYIGISTLVGLVTTTFTALGEEIGWRGLLVPELNNVTNFTKTSLISGIVWAVWHYPGMLFADYHSEAPLWYALICFTLMAVSFSVIMAWIRLKSGSLWTATFLHASHNVFVQGIFTPLTADTGPTEYFIDEFGIGLALIYTATAFLFWKFRSALPESRSTMQEAEK